MKSRGGLFLPGWESTRGSHSRNAKLTEARVVMIRKSQLPIATIAKVFGVNIKTIRDVRNRRRWAHVQ